MSKPVRILHVFAGFSPNAEKLMMGMDLFVLPSLYEGLPLTLIEAQCSGLPCLISDSISRNVIKTPLVQMLSIQENEQRWVDRILEIADQTHQRDRSEWSSFFRDTEFDIRVQAIRYEALIKQVLSKNVASGQDSR